MGCIWLKLPLDSSNVEAAQKCSDQESRFHLNYSKKCFKINSRKIRKAIFCFDGLLFTHHF